MLKRIFGFLFEHRSPKQVVAKNFFWLISGEFVSRFIRSLVILYAARVLGVAEYGVFSYALGLAGFFAIFSGMGLDIILTRNVVQDPQARSRHFSTSLVLKMVLLLGSALLVLFIAPLFSRLPGARSLLPFISILIILDGIRNFVIALFRALERMEREALVTLITNVSITLLGFGILSLSASSFAFLSAYIGGVAIGALVAAFLIRSEIFSLFRNFDRTLIPNLIRTSWPLALSSTFALFFTQTDIIMLGFWHNASVVGYYSAPLRIIQILQIFPQLVGIVVFPLISRLSASPDHSSRLKDVLQRTFLFSFMLSIPLVLGGIIVARPLTEFLFGSAYLPSVFSFQILLLGLLFVFPDRFLSGVIFAHNRHHPLSWYIGLSALVNIIGNIILIPSYGTFGSAISTVFAQATYFFLMWRLSQKVVRITFFAQLSRIAAAGACMGLITFALSSFFHIHVLSLIGISALFYIFFLTLFKNQLMLDALRFIRGFLPRLFPR